MAGMSGLFISLKTVGAHVVRGIFLQALCNGTKTSRRPRRFSARISGASSVRKKIFVLLQVMEKRQLRGSTGGGVNNPVGPKCMF